MTWYPATYVNEVRMTNMNMRPNATSGMYEHLEGESREHRLLLQAVSH